MFFFLDLDIFCEVFSTIPYFITMRHTMDMFVFLEFTMFPVSFLLSLVYHLSVNARVFVLSLKKFHNTDMSQVTSFVFFGTVSFTVLSLPSIYSIYQ